MNFFLLFRICFTFLFSFVARESKLIPRGSEKKVRPLSNSAIWHVFLCQQQQSHGRNLFHPNISKCPFSKTYFSFLFLFVPFFHFAIQISKALPKIGVTDDFQPKMQISFSWMSWKEENTTSDHPHNWNRNFSSFSFSSTFYFGGTF